MRQHNGSLNDAHFNRHRAGAGDRAQVGQIAPALPGRPVLDAACAAQKRGNMRRCLHLVLAAGSTVLHQGGFLSSYNNAAARTTSTLSGVWGLRARRVLRSLICAAHLSARRACHLQARTCIPGKTCERPSQAAVFNSVLRCKLDLFRPSRMEHQTDAGAVAQLKTRAGSHLSSDMSGPRGIMVDSRAPGGSGTATSSSA